MKLENRKLTIETGDKPGHYKYHGVDAISKGETDFEFDLGYTFQTPLEIKYVPYVSQVWGPAALNTDEAFNSPEVAALEIDFPAEDDGSDLYFVQCVTLQEYEGTEEGTYGNKVGQPVVVDKLGFIPNNGSGYKLIAVMVGDTVKTIKGWPDVIPGAQ